MLNTILKPILNSSVHSFSEESIGVMLSYQHHRVTVGTDDGYLILPIHQILFIQSDSNYAILHIANGKKILTSKTLKIWEHKVNHPFFVRCHRSFYINTRYIDHISLNENTINMLSHSIPISRDRKRNISLMMKSVDFATYDGK